MNEEKDNKSLVKLSKYEKLIYNFNQNGECIVSCFGFIEHDRNADPDQLYLNENKFNLELAKRAFNYLIKRHPLLRARLEVASYDECASKPYESNISLRIGAAADSWSYVERGNIQWERINKEEQLIKRIEKLNGQLFDFDDKSKPLWRVNIFENNCGGGDSDQKKFVILIVIPLFLVDGMCICTLMIEYLNVINSILLNRECKEMTERLELIENIDQLIERHQLAPKTTDKTDQNQLEINARLPGVFRGDLEKGLKLNPFKFDRTLTKMLIDYCKLNKMKMTALISTLVIHSLKNLYEENGIHFPKDFTFGMAANLRIRVEPNIDFSHLRYLSTLIGIDLFYPEFSGKFENLKTDSAYLDEKIQQAVDLEHGSFFLDQLNHEGIEADEKLFDECQSDLLKFRRLLDCDLRDDLIISNIGNYIWNKIKNSTSNNKNSSDPFKIEEIYFGDSPSAWPQIEPGLILHLSYWNDQIMFLLSSNRSAINSTHTDRLVEIIQSNARKLLNL